MKIITRYISEDGAEWKDCLSALQRDALIQQNKADTEKRFEPTPQSRMDFYVVACKLRDAVNRYRDTSLQKDADELDRLTSLFNLPYSVFLEAISREARS